jgi:alpha-mannosidase
MQAFLVSHIHWDREWYRTFQAFRARLVDTVDSVLELMASDPGYVFVLDGQAVILEDYLQIRPHRRDELKRAARAGRLAIGPWYVQPDSLLPSGEAHVRNLLEGRRVAARIGPPSTIAYTPDSFGHPAQFPQLLRGFGLDAFVYWRGNGDEIAELPAEYVWESPDGTWILACHLGAGYFAAAALPHDTDAAADRLAKLVEELAARTRNDRVLLMNGSDHLLPDPHTRAVAQALAARSGATVVRARLEDFVDGIDAGALPRFGGELVGGRVANLLPGVWSTRTYLKLRNRRCEAELEGWAEPFVAIASLLGAPDERPSLRLAWRSLLHNQAHDSICGCSQDAVHDQMLARYDTSAELASETTARALERIAGLGAQRRVPPSRTQTIAVFNPSPHARTDVVRLPLDAYPPLEGGETELKIHPLIRANLKPQHFTVDGKPARLVEVAGGTRMQLVPDQKLYELEFVAEDVPATGYRTFALEPSDDGGRDDEDDGSEISNGDVTIRTENEHFVVQLGASEFRAFLFEDSFDRGDSYDFDPLSPSFGGLESQDVRRRRHSGGVQELELSTRWLGPAGLNTARDGRADDDVVCELVINARVAPRVNRADFVVRFVNRARDHRVRLLFVTNGAADRFEAATTFDVAIRTAAHPEATGWRHPAPATFPHQGWVHCNGLSVVAPGLPEAEVIGGKIVAVTLLRSVGWLSRLDVHSRPSGAGPSMPTPGAQCLGTVEAHISLLAGLDPRAARDAELGLHAVIAGDGPLAPAGSFLALEPRELLLSALKPADDGDGVVLRVLNPTDHTHEAAATLALPVTRASAVRLDETPSDDTVELRGGVLRFAVPPHALRSVLLRT